MFDAQKTIENIINVSVQKLRPLAPQALTLGISGGLDSAVTAALGKRVAERLNIPQIGWVLPIEQDPIEIHKATTIARQFTDYWGFKDLTEAYKSLRDNMRSNIKLTLGDNSTQTLEQHVTDQDRDIIANGNIKARVRMVFLYEMARNARGPVLSTDNRSEYLLGFWTLHGDVGDFGMIQNLWKGSEIPAIAKELSVPSWCISQPPTDGLVGQTDEQQLQANYQVADVILARLLTGDTPNHPIAERFNSPVVKFKRQAPINLSRDEIVADDQMGW